jgi:ABC-type uncharacterized transport system ATPase component
MTPTLKLITIRAYDSYVNAQLAVNKLLSEGVQSFLRDEHTVTLDPFLSNAIGGIKLQVMQKDRAFALMILDTAQL